MTLSRLMMLPILAALAIPAAAQTGAPGTQAPAAAPETSDRTPGKRTPTPLEQMDRVPSDSSSASGAAPGTSGSATGATPSGPPAQAGETSDRTPKNHPGTSGQPAQQK